MSLFGTSPPENETSAVSSPGRLRGAAAEAGGGLFDDEHASKASSNNLFDDEPTSKASSNSLFADDNDDEHSGRGGSPWDLPSARRKQQSRAELIRNLLPAADVPESYIEAFDTAVREEHDGKISAGGIAKLFAAARLDADAQSSIMGVIVPGGSSDSDDVSLDRGEFNVLLALVGLAQEGEVISLDGVDERRRNLPKPKLAGLTAEPILPPVAELSAKPPQTPPKDEPVKTQQQQQQPSEPTSHLAQVAQAAMDDPEDDPWNTPDVHKNHAHSRPNGAGSQGANGNTAFGDIPTPTIGGRTVSQYATGATATPSSAGARQSRGSSHPVGTPGGWGGYFDGNSAAIGAGFGESPQNPTANPFGSAPDRAPHVIQPPNLPQNSSAGRTGPMPEDKILVTLMPEKEGVFMFQHHNYEITSQRRQSKVIRRYSDFVWLLDCLNKRYPFRVLPLLPPKRMGVNGNHLSNDNGFIEKRRRGLARFLNAVVRHPVLSQEQLVVMFLTVPTELAVWRKQATISVQEEFADQALPPGLEDSLPETLEDLFTRTRAGVRRSAEIYINVCNILDRLIKRTEGVAADHARIAMSLASLTDVSADTYASDTNEVPLLNDGLVAMSNHLRTCQSLMEDESKGWDEGVLEDLKRQRDALVSVREMFERRERLDKDNVPYLERRIQTNETKLANLRSKPEGLVKPGEIEKVAENIIKDKESIVQQHNRHIFVKQCIRDELVTFQSSQYHVSRWNQDWAGERVKYAEMLAENWRRLLDELEGMPLGD